MSRSVSCEISSNISLFNVVSKDVCSLLGYSSNLHLSERILRNIISVLRKSVNKIWIGLLYFWNHCYWNWNKIQIKFVANTKCKQSLLQKNKIHTKSVAKKIYKQSLLQVQNTNKVCGKYKLQKKFVANPKYRNSGCKTGLGGAS